MFWRSSVLPTLLWIPVAILSAAAGILIVLHDESLIPAPLWMSPEEIRRIVNRLDFLYGPLVLAFMAAGFGGGTAAFIPIISRLISGYTYRNAFLITGIVQGIVIAIVAQFLRNPPGGFIAPAAPAVSAPKTTFRRSSFS